MRWGGKLHEPVEASTDEGSSPTPTTDYAVVGRMRRAFTWF